VETCSAARADAVRRCLRRSSHLETHQRQLTSIEAVEHADYGRPRMAVNAKNRIRSQMEQSLSQLLSETFINERSARLLEEVARENRKPARSSPPSSTSPASARISLESLSPLAEARTSSTAASVGPRS